MLISAVRFEVDPVLDILKKHQIPHAYHECGVGPLNAARKSLQLREEVRNKNVLYLGSAGTFSNFDKPHLCKVNQVFWLPTGERMGLAKHMEGLHRPISLVDSQLFDLPAKKVLTSTSVSLVNDISLDGLPNREQLIENMEAYSLLEGLTSSIKNLDVILGVTNAVGSEGSKQWSENFKNVAKITADYLESKLDIVEALI